MGQLLTDLSAMWSQWLWPLLLFAFGLGLVVFVHELGHFLVAKATGIKVERFAFGFGPRLVGVVRNGTDYCINLLPLGGYLKMLGQEDVKEVQEIADPHAYQNKSVGVRLAVVSAGVVMNVLLAAALFVLVAMIGKNYPAPVVGAVSPGFPASEARIAWTGQIGTPTSQPSSATTEEGRPKESIGLRPGDRILSIADGGAALGLISQPVTRFSDIYLVSALAKPDHTYLFTVERHQDGRTLVGRARIGLKRRGDDNQYLFGLAPAADTTFGAYDDLITRQPFQDGDKLLAIDGQAVEHFWDIEPVERTLTGDPVMVTVRRKDRPVDVEVVPRLALRDNVLWLKNGSRLRATLIGGKDGLVDCLTADGETVAISQDDIAGGATREPVDILGLIPRVRVVGVWQNSPADKAGIQPGDVIVGYGDRSAPTTWEFLQLTRQYAGKGTNIVVLRGEEAHKLWIVPKEHQDAMIVEADEDQLVVAGIRPGSPAAKAGIEPEAVIKAINDKPVNTWIDAYQVLKDFLGQEIKVTYQIGARKQTADLGVVDTNVFDPADYTMSVFGAAVAFQPLEVKIVETNPLKALSWGAKETGKLIVSTYVTLARLSEGTVSAKSLVGPLGIGAIAVKAGRKSMIDFVYFIAFISASLAVFNFLPIPVTDGGHATFLLIEKIRRKPLPPRVIYVAQMIGLVLLVTVFLALTWQDFARLIGGWW